MRPRKGREQRRTTLGARRAIGHAKATGRRATTGLRRQGNGRGIGKRLRGKLT